MRDLCTEIVVCPPGAIAEALAALRAADPLDEIGAGGPEHLLVLLFGHLGAADCLVQQRHQAVDARRREGVGGRRGRRSLRAPRCRPRCRLRATDGPRRGPRGTGGSRLLRPLDRFPELPLETLRRGRWHGSLGAWRLKLAAAVVV